MFAPNGKSRTVFNNMNHEQTDTLFGPWKQSASGVQNIYSFTKQKLAGLKTVGLHLNTRKGK